MNNVWKGLAIGAFVGAAVGLVLDLLRGAGKGAAAVAEMAREHGPEVVAAAASVASAGAERLREADLPDKLRQAAQAAATSDTGQKVRDVAGSTLAAGSAAAKTLIASASDAVDDLRHEK